MTRIIEVAKFRVRPGGSAALVSEHENALAAIQRAHPGLLRVRLIHLGGDVWADVAEWADADSARAAQRGAMSIPEFADWTRHIMEDLSLDHGTVHSIVQDRNRTVVPTS